jgi:hypothetical protein
VNGDWVNPGREGQRPRGPYRGDVPGAEHVPSGYYDWCRRGRRPARGRCADDLALTEQIVHEPFRYYGSPRIREELLAENPGRVGTGLRG